MSTSVLRRTTAQLFMVGIPGPTIDPETAAFLTDRPPGGVILFKRNVRTARQVRSLVDSLHATGSGVRPIVSIDHEGGRVHRLPRPFTHFPPAASWTDPRTAEAVGLAMGRELAAVGIDLDFAPVLVANPSYLDSLGWAFFRQGRLDLADPPLTKAADQLPKSSTVNEHLGDLRFRQERYADAVAAFERSLAGDGDSIDRVKVEKKVRDARLRVKK